MDAPVLLWEAWRTQVKQLFPHLHGHQQKTLAWMILGMVLSGSAVLQRMAEGLYGISTAKMPSIERRLARFVANDRIHVTPIWTQFLSQILPFWRAQRVLLVLDCTPFGERATIVYVGLLVHSRVLPLAWRVMPAQQKWPQGQWEIVSSLLDQLSPHFQGTDCTLLADRGLVGRPLVQLCRERHWHYLLRVRREHTCRRWMGRWTAWRPLGKLLTQPGQQWCGRIQRLSGANLGDQSQRGLGASLPGGLVAHLGSTGRASTDLRVRRPHAGGSHVSRQQKSWVEPRSEPDCEPVPPGPAALGAVSGAVVGDPFELRPACIMANGIGLIGMIGVT